MNTLRLLPGLFLVLMCTAVADDEPAGACTYVQENMFAGPFNVCQAPVSEALCTELGETDDNHDASFAEGEECDTDEGIVGICDLGDSKVYYYDGDAFGLEIGCGFQGGEWILGEAEEDGEDEAEE